LRLDEELTMLSSLLRRYKPKQKSDADTGARSARRETPDGGPPLTREERRANLTELEKALNDKMKCHAGRNQVFVRSVLTGGGPTTPRITLKCPLRKDIGLNQHVFYEHIRDVCCSDPEQCPAYRDFRDRFVAT
jgi:hypothetical protein